METIIKITYLKLVIHIYNSDRRVKKILKRYLLQSLKLNTLKIYDL